MNLATTKLMKFKVNQFIFQSENVVNETIDKHMPTYVKKIYSKLITSPT